MIFAFFKRHRKPPPIQITRLRTAKDMHCRCNVIRAINSRTRGRIWGWRQ